MQKEKKLKNSACPSEAFKRRRGFVILFALTLSSILLVIALSIANIALQEINFGTGVRDANNAFFAADTGAECALYNDKSGSNIFTLSSSATSINCANLTISLTESGASPILFWDFVVSSLGSVGQSCARVKVQKDFSDPDNPVTVINSKGYNIGDSLCTSTNPNRTERELELNY